MNELLKAATEMFQSFTALARYALEQERAKTGDIAARPTDPAPPAVEPKKERKTRAPKAEAPAASTVDMDVIGPSPKDMGEDESLKEVRAVAKLYVQRFGNQQDGIAAFRKLMADKFKVARIDDLVHAQRLAVIIEAKAEIAKADSTQRQPVGAGVEV